MSKCVMPIALTKIPPGKGCNFSVALNKTFCPTPPPLTHRQLKHGQRTKTNKTIPFVSPSLPFRTKLTIRIKKQISIPS